MDIKALKDAIKNKRIEWQRHSLERMLERNISRSTVVEAILNGELIEDYSRDRSFPSGLFLGWIGQIPIHVIVSHDSSNEKAFIITAYEPDHKHLEPGLKMRRTR